LRFCALRRLSFDQLFRFTRLLVLSSYLPFVHCNVGTANGDQLGQFGISRSQRLALGNQIFVALTVGGNAEPQFIGPVGYLFLAKKRLFLRRFECV
jgi:hypothetical protein